MPKYRELLKDRNFFLYSAGQFITQFGDRLVQIILVGLVYKVSPGSTMRLAKAFSFTLLPAFFISPVAGVWVDRWNNKETMIVCGIIMGSIVMALPLFAATNQLIPVYIAVFSIFTCACFFLPAKFAIIPDLVPQERLLLANSLSMITTVVGGVAGFTLGGLILEFLDVKKTAYLNAMIYFASAATLSLIRYRPRKKKEEEPGHLKSMIREALRTSFFYELKEGLRHLVSGKKMKFIMCILFLITSLVGAMYVVAVVFIQEVMGSMTKDIGLFGLFLCAGFLAGSYFYGKLGALFSKDRAIYLSLLGCGVFIMLFSAGLKITASFLLGGVSVFLLGAASSPIMISASTIIHENIRDGMRGRVFSSLGVIMNLGWLVFMFAASAFAEIIGKVWVLLISGAVFALFGVAGLAVNSRKAG